MSVTKEKELFIKQVPQVEIDNFSNIPSAIYYAPGGKFYIGNQAFDEASNPLLINRDFKVDLGFHAAAKKSTFQTGDGTRRSAFALAQDFLQGLLKATNGWLESREGGAEAASVLIAEPLQMHSEQNSTWLSQYRHNLKEILENRNFEGLSKISFRKVDFLPEPFAAFQYYRYGVKHPLIAARQQHSVLVLDFGGGTFDVSVISTTKEGDISWSGRNSLPQGASSRPVGGFFINRKIVEHLLGLNFNVPQKSVLRRALDTYEKVRTGKQDPTLLSSELKEFVTNFQRASLEIESAKIALSRQIKLWDLDANIPLSVTVSLAADFFSDSPNFRNYRFSAQELRDLFVDKIWNPELKPTVRKALEGATAYIEKQPIDLVLLSGGSANIGWLERLLRRDFASVLDVAPAEILLLDDYQEVVAKGLAAECARRFATENGDGDFGSITYNRLYLMLDVRDDGCRPRAFVPLNPAIPNHVQTPGLLLESAHYLSNFVDTPIAWRVKQIRARPKVVEYFFSRSGLDIEDLNGRLNFEQTKAIAPPRCDFDNDLKIELTVREDGTANPRFIFRSGRTREDSQDFDGRPFALDMTYAQDRKAQAYIGLDFGTSNSAISYVKSGDIQLYKHRAGDKGWQELDALTSKLPYPVAFPLLKYLSAGTREEQLEKAARNAIEATLSFLLFCVYFDYGLVKRTQGYAITTRFFADFRQNSAGPVWGLLRRFLQETDLKKGGGFTAPLLKLLKDPPYELINDGVSLLGKMKHEKAEEADTGTADWKEILLALCNIGNEVFRDAHFGFFEDVTRDAFSGKIYGYFRKSNGQPPFYSRLPVEMGEFPPVKMPYLLLAERKVAISFLPLMLWWDAKLPNEFDHGSLFFYDKSTEKDFEFKPVGAQKTLATSSDNKLSGLDDRLRRLKQKDEAPDQLEVRTTSAD